MCSVILFSFAARQKLEQRLAATPEALGTRMDDIARRLNLIFPDGHAAIVQNLYGGYRVRPDEYILLVELSGGDPFAADASRPERCSPRCDGGGRYVVKLGPTETLREELAAWRECRPDGLRHDLVLMPVEPRPSERLLEGLVYDDAQQFIGVDQTLTLEAAMLDAARLGYPAPESVGDVLFQLYERLGVLLYRYSFRSPPPEPREGLTADELGLDSHFARNLDAWDRRDRVAFEPRASAGMHTDDTPLGEHFRDPVSFFRAVCRHAATGGDPADFLPILLRGRGHGDLHGRNVLVGRVRDRVLWPAVYDHEHMGRRNLIGWDFVKLETEFKARAYPELFPGPPDVSVPAIVKFEAELFARTEDHRESGRWPDHPERDDHAGRLAWLVLKIREAACRHLGLLRNRGREWLAEYYFLLTLYGLNAIRFANLEPTELRAVYLSAGTACARYVYDRERRMAEPTPPAPFPTKEGEQDLAPSPLGGGGWGRGLRVPSHSATTPN